MGGAAEERVVAVFTARVGGAVKHTVSVPTAFFQALGQPHLFTMREDGDRVVYEPLRVDGAVRRLLQRRSAAGRFYAVRLPAGLRASARFLVERGGALVLGEPREGERWWERRGGRFVTLPGEVVEGWGLPRYVVVRQGADGVRLEPLRVEGKVVSLWPGRRLAVPPWLAETGKALVRLVDGRLEVAPAPAGTPLSRRWWEGWHRLSRLHEGAEFRCGLCGRRFSTLLQAVRHAAAEHGVSFAGRPRVALRRLFEAGVVEKEAVLSEEYVAKVLRLLLAPCRGRRASIPLSRVIEVVYGAKSMARGGTRARRLRALLERMRGVELDGWRLEGIAGNRKGARLRLLFSRTC